MKTAIALPLSLLSLAHASAIHSLFHRDGTCQVLSGVTTTFYGFPDNDPPSAQTAYSCAGRDGTAGGTGTYDDPLTMASAPGEFNQCEVVYSAYLKKYLVFQDTCAQCTSDYSAGTQHIDIWTGSSTVSGGQTQIDCEDSLTPDSSDFVRNPPTDLDVDTAALFANGQCDTGATYNGNAGSCSGTGSGGSSTATSSAAAPTGTSTASCEWEGHCAGAACSSDDDCSDSLTCNSGTCGSS